MHVIGKPKKALIVNKTINSRLIQNNFNNNNVIENITTTRTNTNLYNLNGRHNIIKLPNEIKTKGKNNHNTSSPTNIC